MFDALDLVNQGLADPPLPVSNSDPALIEAKKTRALAIRAMCATQIESGFVSAALGSKTFYPSDAASQLNTASVAVCGGWLWCQEANGLWSMIHHTVPQGMQVRADLAAHIQTQQLRHAERLRTIMGASDVTAVNAVVW